MTEILPCVTCKHFLDKGDLFLYCKKFSYEVPNYVTGDVYVKFPLCVLTREPTGECGPEGKGWERAEERVDPPRKSPFTRFRKFLDLINF